jgi:hypothetical protein
VGKYATKGCFHETRLKGNGHINALSFNFLGAYLVKMPDIDDIYT